MKNRITAWMDRERSLFRRLLFGFGGVMLAAWAGVVAWTVYEIKADQQRFAQGQLRTAARQALLALRPVADQPDQIRATAEQIERLQTELHGAMNVLLSPYRIQVWKDQGLVHASSHLPDAPPSPADMARLGQLPVSGAAWFSWSEAQAGTGLVVRVAQESLFGFAMGWTSLGFYLLPLLVSFPFLLLPAWFIVRRGLQPLTSIVSDIERRTASDLSPLAPSAYRELRPLTQSVNRLMERLARGLAREQEFLQDAAHELKTPLAIIQINADALRDARDPPRRQQALEGLSQGVERASHTVHQLLALARTGADHDGAAMHEADLAQLLRERLGLAAPLALLRGIELALEAPDRCCLPLHLESAVALIDNLIDNALKYSPEQGHVTLCLRCEQGAVRLTVSDEGPGIPAPWRTQVFERFFRLPGQDQSGSGLGLAIAERAAVRNQARLRLEDGPGGRGLRVVLEFSQAPAQT